MNPLTLSGPMFLLFYGIFAFTVLLLMMVVRRALEAGPLPKLDLRDPYLFACLSGGPAEVIRVSTVDLVDRGLLTLAGGGARAVRDKAPAFVQRRIVVVRDPEPGPATGRRRRL